MADLPQNPSQGMLETDCRCPYCDYGPLSGYTGVSEDCKAKPVTGDFTICVKCGGLLVFDKNLNSVKPSPGKFLLGMADPSIWPYVEKARLIILKSE